VDSDHDGPMTLFDCDGHGEPEFAFTYERRREHGASEALLVFRYRAGRIERCPTAPGAQYLEEVDHDGRPDPVITHRKYSRTTDEPEDISCGDMAEAPSIAARSVTGRRCSQSDPAVREYNRRACPVSPPCDRRPPRERPRGRGAHRAKRRVPLAATGACGFPRSWRRCGRAGSG
jgi:hypothetical protein